MNGSVMRASRYSSILPVDIGDGIKQCVGWHPFATGSPATTLGFYFWLIPDYNTEELNGMNLCANKSKLTKKSYLSFLGYECGLTSIIFLIYVVNKAG